MGLGIPAGLSPIANAPILVKLINSSADSKMRRIGILATRSRNHTTWS